MNKKIENKINYTVTMPCHKKLLNHQTTSAKLHMWHAT